MGWLELIAAVGGAGLAWWNSRKAEDKASDAYNKAVDINSQQYKDFIQFMQSEKAKEIAYNEQQALKNVPGQQGMLWQLMGGNEADKSKYQFGNAWGGVPEYMQAPGTGMQDAIEPPASGGDGGNGFGPIIDEGDWGKTRDNIYHDVSEPFTGIAKSIGTMGETLGSAFKTAPENLLKSAGWLTDLLYGVNTFGTSGGDIKKEPTYNTGYDIASNNPYGEFSGKYIPSRKVTDADVQKGGKDLVDTHIELYGPAATYNMLKLSGSGSKDELLDYMLKNYPPESGGKKIDNLDMSDRLSIDKKINEYNDQGLKVTNVEYLKDEKKSKNILFETSDGKKHYFAGDDFFDVRNNPQLDKIIFNQEEQTTAFGLDPDYIKSGIGKDMTYKHTDAMMHAIRDIEHNGWKIEGIDFAKGDKSKIEITHSQGKKIISAEDAFPGQDFSDIDHLELRDNGALYGIGASGEESLKEIDFQKKATNVKTLNDGTVDITWNDGSTENRKIKDMFPDIDASQIGEIKINNSGQIYAAGQAPIAKGVELLDDGTAQITYSDGSTKVSQLEEIFPNRDDISNITNLEVDDKGRILGSWRTGETVEGDTAIASKTTETGLPTVPATETETLTGYQPYGMTKKEASGLFDVGAQQGRLFQNAWQQQGQGMAGNVASQVKDAYAGISDLAAFRNPYGQYGAGLGMVRDVQRQATPGMLEALNYPQQQANEMAMGISSNLLNQPALNYQGVPQYPMPATQEANYLPAQYQQQLGAMGLLGLSELFGNDWDLNLSNPFAKKDPFASSQNYQSQRTSSNSNPYSSGYGYIPLY